MSRSPTRVRWFHGKNKARNRIEKLRESSSVYAGSRRPAPCQVLHELEQNGPVCSGPEHSEARHAVPDRHDPSPSQLAQRALSENRRRKQVSSRWRALRMIGQKNVTIASPPKQTRFCDLSKVRRVSFSEPPKRSSYRGGGGLSRFAARPTHP